MLSRAGLHRIIEEQWVVALAHAGFSGSQAKHWVCTGHEAHKRVGSAVYFKPIQAPDGVDFLTAEQRAEVLSETYAQVHRVFLFEEAFELDEEPELVSALAGALLRHELEHARQRDHWGSDFVDLDEERIQDAIEVKAGGVPGSNWLYNCKPSEMDANSASSQFLRDHHPLQVDAIRAGEARQLAGFNTGPEPIDTLRERTIGFLLQFRQILEERAHPLSVSAYLKLHDRKAAELWDVIVAFDVG
jgi:hypothetical protein